MVPVPCEIVTVTDLAFRLATRTSGCVADRIPLPIISAVVGGDAWPAGSHRPASIVDLLLAVSDLR